MVNNLVVKKGIIAVGILGVFVLTFLLIKEIVIPITLGLLAAYILSPAQKWLTKIIKRRGLVAFLLIIGMISLILIPMVYLTPILINQTFKTYVTLQNLDLAEVLRTFMNPETASRVAISIDNILGKVFSSFLSQFTEILVNLPSIILQFAVFLFTFFFAMRDSEKIKEYLSELSPFSDSTEKKFMKEFRGITNAIVFGQVFIGVIQGLALGIGLFILGVPNALTLTVIASLASIIPILGSWIVWMPVSIFLLLGGQTFAGIFLFIYGAIFVSTIDNFLRPYFLSRQSNLPISLSLIATIGGLYLFGIMGLVFGPLVFAYALIILDFYKKGKLDELFQK